MTERPILFSGAMVRSLLDGRKTQTRRIVKNQPPVDVSPICVERYHPTIVTRSGDEEPGAEIFGAYSDDGDWGSKCPCGEPGDRLWVRETFVAFGRWETRFSAKKGRDEWHFVDMTLETGRQYRYGGALPNAKRDSVTPTWWRRPAIHMPRTASRILLDVTGVRIDRLQSISATDARAEGIEFQEHSIAGQICRSWKAYGSADGWYPEGIDIAPIHSYWSLWDSLNAARGFGWHTNPWVWVVEFRRVQQ